MEINNRKFVINQTIILLGYGIQGVWFGMSCAWTMASVIYCIIIYRIDWEQEAIDSLKRTKEGLQSIVQH
jgi:Na+-driven multidrug efflux pump